MCGNVHVSMHVCEHACFLLPLNDLGQLADHYCHWFLELSFSRISESTTGYTFTPCVGSFMSPGIDRRHHHVFRKTQANVGLQNCLSFEIAAGGIEPPSS